MDKIVISRFQPATWCTEAGARKKLAALEAKGLPSFFNWRFITLTVNRDKFSSAQAAYEYIKPRMREFMRELRGYLGKGKLRYCYKLEFQKDGGWPHWHMLLDYKKKIDHSDLSSVWGNGFVYIDRVKVARLPYQFKYICKEVGELPRWFTDQKRPRVFQSSRLFCSAAPKLEAVGEVGSEDAPPPRRSTLTTLFRRLKVWAQMVQVKVDGFFMMTINVGKSWGDWLSDLWITYKDSLVRYIDAWSVQIPAPLLLEMQMEQMAYETERW